MSVPCQYPFGLFQNHISELVEGFNLQRSAAFKLYAIKVMPSKYLKIHSLISFLRLIMILSDLRYFSWFGRLWGWQWCWWHRYVGDFMMATDFRCWWQNHYVGDLFRYVGDFLNVLNRSPTSQTCHQHIWSPTSVTNIDVTLFCWHSEIRQKKCTKIMHLEAGSLQ